MIHWIMGLIGLCMFGVSYLYLGFNSFTFGTVVGIIGIVFVGSPFYVSYRLKDAKSSGGEEQ